MSKESDSIGSDAKDPSNPLLSLAPMLSEWLDICEREPPSEFSTWLKGLNLDAGEVDKG